MQSVDVFQRHSDIHMPTEPSNAAAREITKKNVQSPCPTSESDTIPDISTWKLPLCQVKLFVEARRHHGGSRAMERPPEPLRPCVPRSPHSATHSTQPNNPLREGLGRWDAHGGCHQKTNPVRIKVGLLQTDGWTDHPRMNPTAQHQNANTLTPTASPATTTTE